MSDHNTQLLYQVLLAQDRLLNHLTGTIMAQLEQLAADVAAQTTVIASAEKLLTSLHAQLSDAFAKIVNTGDVSALQGIIRSVETNTATLAAAVIANTVADTGAVSTNTVADTGAVSSTPVAEAPAEPAPAPAPAVEADPLAPHPEA